MNITTFWIVIGGGVVLGAFVGAAVFGFFVGSQRPSGALWAGKRRSVSREEAEVSLSDFRRELQVLRKKRDVVDVYSSDYFHTLQESGWDALHKILARLTSAEEQLEELFKEGRYEEAYQLSECLLDRLSPEEARQVQSYFPSFRDIWHWRIESADLVMTMLAKLEAAAMQTQQAGVRRKRDRKPTLMAISDLQDLTSK